MTALTFDAVGSRFFETGVNKGVLYPIDGSAGVSWNGIVSVTENVSGGEQSSVWLDSQKYLDIIANEDFQATLVAFGAPSQFAVCDGRSQIAPGLIATQQPRKLFGMSYKTLIGNDVDGSNHGYKLHLVYNCTASPTARTHQTQADTVTSETYSWQLNCVPPNASVFKPTAHFEVNSLLADPTKLAALELLLYGTTGVNPTLPTQAAVITLLT